MGLILLTEKRYFKRMWEEEYYIFDSKTISEEEFDEKVEYEDYRAFEDSMQGDEVVECLNKLNEKNEQLRQSNKQLRANKKDCEKGRINERKSFEKFDKSRIERIRFLEKRLKDNGLSIYINK